MHKTAGFLYGLDLHHLDHLAPISSLLGIPLICTEEIPAALAKEFYPGLQVKFMPDTESILKRFDALITCLPKELIDPLFFFDEHKLRKKLLTIWLPHGNSDKDNLGALTKETLTLIYGDQMQDRFKENRIKAKTLIIGQFRKYCVYKKFLPPAGKTLLYAPTWNHSDVKADLHFIYNYLPPTYNLLIKLHPNTLSKNLHLPYEEQKNIRFIHDIPTIFPILEKTDILITDTSSIAYDFLAFNRPIFFLTSDRTPIHRTGYITSLQTLFEDLNREDIFDERRSALYRYAFSETAHYKAIPLFIENYFQTEPHLL